MAGHSAQTPPGLAPEPAGSNGWAGYGAARAARDGDPLGEDVGLAAADAAMATEERAKRARDDEEERARTAASPLTEAKMIALLERNSQSTVWATLEGIEPRIAGIEQKQCNTDRRFDDMGAVLTELTKKQAENDARLTQLQQAQSSGSTRATSDPGFTVPTNNEAFIRRYWKCTALPPLGPLSSKAYHLPW